MLFTTRNKFKLNNITFFSKMPKYPKSKTLQESGTKMRNRNGFQSYSENIINPYSQNRRNVNHKFRIVRIEQFWQF